MNPEKSVEPGKKVVVVKQGKSLLLFLVSNVENPRIPGYPSFCVARFREESLEEREKEAQLTADKINKLLKSERHQVELWKNLAGRMLAALSQCRHELNSFCIKSDSRIKGNITFPTTGMDMADQAIAEYNEVGK